MEKSESRLGFLMRQLELTGRDMAAALSIDITTVSKWRTGQRRMLYGSKYIHAVSEYLLDSDMEKRKEVVHRILADYSPGADLKSPDTAADVLALWLTDDDRVPAKQSREDSGKSGYTASMQVFTGTAGVREAFGQFWRRSLRAIPGEILIVDFGDIDFNDFAADEKEDNVRLMAEAIRHGHRIKIIDGAADDYKPYLSIFRWMAVYLSEAVEVYYRQSRDNRENRYSIYLLPGVCALYTMGLDRPGEEHHCLLLEDAASVDFFEQSAHVSFGYSRKMIELVRVEDILGMLDVLSEHLVSKQLTYMLNPTPTFRSMSTELLRDVLLDNGVQGRVLEICLEANRRTRIIRERCDYRQIYDLDAMEDRAKQPYSTDYDLSMICGKEIRVSRRNLQRHMRELSRFPHTDSYTLTLTHLRDMEVLPVNISMIVQDDRLVVAWDAKKYACRMYSRALNIVGGFYNYLEEVWDSIPNICKDPQWRDRQFSKLITMLA